MQLAELQRPEPRRSFYLKTVQKLHLSGGRTGIGMRTTFQGPSEMHRRMSGHAWASTPVGPVETWPQSLRSTVKTLLSSRYPMVLTWGPQYTQFYNDAYAALIGERHPAALGIDIRITLAEGWNTLGPMIDQVMRTGIANWTPALPLEMNRAGYREEAYFSVSHAPAEDDDGRIAGMLAVCSEVTQQILAERRTRLLRDLALKAGATQSVSATCLDLAAAISDYALDVPFALIYLRGEGGTTLELRAAVGLEEGSPESPARVDLQSPSTSWPFTLAMKGEIIKVENVAEHLVLNGGFFNDPLDSALVMPLASADGKEPGGVLVVGVSPNRELDEGYRSFFELLAGQVSVALRNASAHEDERRRAESLAELDRAKTAFFSNVSHEFRTPLTLMLAPLEDALADESERLGPRQRERIILMQRNAVRLLKLVNTLLDFSSIEAGRAQLSYEPTDLPSLTRELVSHFESTAKRAGLTLTVHAPPLPDRAWVDREAWEKIVFNLLSNAFKFTLEGGIAVSLLSERQGFLLSVRDTGLGIPQRELPHLFERFYRVAGAKGRSHEGSGIGLALVQELVKLHGGLVRAESTLGEGSTFSVWLPAGSAHLPAERVQTGNEPRVDDRLPAEGYEQEVEAWLAGRPANRDSAATSVAGHTLPVARPRVLVADDNADLRAYLAGSLEPYFSVELVGDGQAALEAIRARPPDLVLSDVMMPSLGGFGLLRELRADPSLRAIPLILLSARAGEEASVEGLEAGADDYLVKPFSARELLARVRTQLEMARVRREVAAHEAREASLQDAVQVRDDFLSVASHELKTPLAAFALQLELLERGMTESCRVDAAERLILIRGQVRRITSMVETFLDVSNVASDRVHTKLEELDLAALVAHRVSQMQESMLLAGSVVALESAGPVTGRFDRVRMEQVVQNLLSNAVKYGQGQPIEVRIEEQEGRARLTVTDHGIGLPAEDRDRIWRRFERAVPSRNYGGLGLGLWIARQVVEAHGGTVRCDDTPGGGATFTMELPLERQA